MQTASNSPPARCSLTPSKLIRMPRKRKSTSPYFSLFSRYGSDDMEAYIFSSVRKSLPRSHNYPSLPKTNSQSRTCSDQPQRGGLAFRGLRFDSCFLHRSVQVRFHAVNALDYPSLQVQKLDRSFDLVESIARSRKWASRGEGHRTSLCSMAWSKNSVERSRQIFSLLIPSKTRNVALRTLLYE